MTSIPELYAKIEVFLAEHAASKDGDFAPVSDDDFDTFAEIVREIGKLKWEPDLDGDFPISAYIVNRHVRENLVYRPVTYRHVDKEQYKRDVIANLNTALRDMILSQDLDEIEERDAK